MRRTRLLSLVASLAMVLTACGTNSTTASTATTDLTVVVTTTIWGDIVSAVTGNAATVEVLFPVGADSHDYQLSSAQVALMQEADLVVFNGLQLEEGVLDVIESLEAEGASLLELAPLLDPIAIGAGGLAHNDERGDHEEEGAEADNECDPNTRHAEEGNHEEEEGRCDPHVWMDPRRVAAAVELIAEELTSLDSSVDWSANATPYIAELRALDNEVISLLEAVPEHRRKLVTNHEAFGYFAERYDFEVVGVVVPGGSTLNDPSSAALAELVEIMTDENIDVIFAETVEASTLADAVAAEVGSDVEVVVLFTGSLGGSGSGGETYIDMVRTNAKLITEALS